MPETEPNADPRFVDYYSQQSASDKTRGRFERVRRLILTLRAELKLPTEHLDVVDVGCGAGAQAMLWASGGHWAYGVDISQPLIKLACERALAAGLQARFDVGSAATLGLPDKSADVVLMSELLEHLPEWQPALDEVTRVLRPGGVVYLTTTNRLCPVQHEFSLPAYSWYPVRLKKYCEQRALTTHGHWVQFSSHPAVHWFSFFQLRDYLNARGFTAKDRFDVMDIQNSSFRRAMVAAVQAAAPLRLAAHFLTSGTMVVAHRRF